MHRQLSAPALLAAVALTLAGCGAPQNAGTDTGKGGTPSATAPSSSVPAAPEGEKDGDTAAVPETLRFNGTTVSGARFDAARLAGKPTVLWFWAPWCPKCKAQGPATADVAEKFEGRANVVGVAGLDGQAAMKDFVASAGVDGFPNLADESGDVWRKFEITQQSTYVILDANGEEAFTGNLPAGKGLSAEVDKLVG
ncbi:redoxin domain-containing protein [Streptomyces sp. TR02-1]|uniref:redoxin domain-containing protein n=1 Tax=Streptomyces sp. TR02-1 TaxID=3385977 RepID=UPI0039A03B4F